MGNERKKFMPSDMIRYDMTSKMRICMSTLQDSSLDKEGMGLRKFGKTFWREREREIERERDKEIDR